MAAYCMFFGYVNEISIFFAWHWPRLVSFVNCSYSWMLHLLCTRWENSNSDSLTTLSPNVFRSLFCVTISKVEFLYFRSWFIYIYSFVSTWQLYVLFQKRFNVWFLILRCQSQTILLSTYLNSPFVTLEKKCDSRFAGYANAQFIKKRHQTTLSFLSASYASPYVFLDRPNPCDAKCLLKLTPISLFHSPAIAPWTRQQYYYRSPPARTCDDHLMLCPSSPVPPVLQNLNPILIRSFVVSN